MSESFYRAARALIRAFLFLFYPYRAEGVQNVPAEGGVILCGNHLSLIDPLYVAAAMRRPVRFMAKKELFTGPLAFILRKGGSFPVDRGNADLRSVKTAIGILEGGGAMGIFPQGSRECKGGDKMLGGVSLIALRSRAQIVPVHIRDRARPFRRTRISFGAPLAMGNPEEKISSAALNDLTERIQRAVQEL